MPDIRVKICGLDRPETVSAAVKSGAAYLGFVFFPKSPRNLDAETARALALDVPPGVAKVALVVDPGDAELDALTATVPLDMIQLHGKESPERVSEVRARTGLPVMKAIGLAGPDDLPALDRYGQAADQILVDAKPAAGAKVPGGNGLAFDWTLLEGRQFPIPWMLAGGLHAGNVVEAIRRTGARQVDLSSGVESAPGVKDPALIRGFFDAVRAAG
ncbi:MAG: phosphoribosylanthranilate isomerase [Pseudomonadota bacterium]